MIKVTTLLAILSLAVGNSLWSSTAHAAARIFNVLDFGAKPDGSADAQVGIAKAISEAQSWVGKLPSRHATVYFPAGTYAVDIPNHIFAISIENASNLTLSGAACSSWTASDCTRLVGASASLSPNRQTRYNSFFFISHSTNIEVQNFYLEKRTPYFVQGHIRKIDPASNTITTETDQGFADFSDPLVQARFNLLMVFTDPSMPFWDHSASACSAPGVQTSNSETCSIFHIIGLESLPNGQWNVKLDKKPPTDFAGKRFLVWRNIGWQPGILASNVGNVIINNIFYTGGGGPAVHVQQSDGDISIRDVTVDIPPESNSLFAATSGFNGSSNRGTITLDHVVVKHTDDDGFHFSAGPYFPVLDQSPDRKTIRIDLCYDGQFHVGDDVAAWNWQAKQAIWSARVRSVSIIADRDEKQYRRTCDITLDKPLPHLKYLRTYSPQNLGIQHDRNDRIVNLSLRTFLTVRNSYLSSMRARCGIIQVSALVENNTCASTPDAGFLVGPEYAWGEGYAVDGIKIINNFFHSIGGTAIYVADIADSIRSPTEKEMRATIAVGPVPKDNKNITISGNRFGDLGVVANGIMGIRGAAITIANAEDVTISGNVYDDGKTLTPLPKDKIIVAPASTSAINLR